MPLSAFCASALANTVGNLLSVPLERFVNCVVRHICNSNESELENLTLEDAAEMLRALRDDNADGVSQNKTKKTSRSYASWMTRVNKVLLDLEQVEREEKKNRLLDCVIGSKLPGKARKIWHRIIDLLNEGKSVEGFLTDKPRETVVKLTTSDIREFSTLQRCLEEILQRLDSNKMITIVIHGLPGVGKRTIMQNLNNHERVARMFDIVIWITVSEHRTMETLQVDIARRLQVDVESTDVARSIYDELNGIRYLLLLDNVRVDIDHTQLHAIGIPNNENGSKVVLTTAELRFCFNMKEFIPIEVKQLNPDESWKMFRQIVGHKISHSVYRNCARQVVNQCGGLPLVITMVANNFKVKDRVDEWRNGLEQLKKWSKVEIKGLTQMHTILKCSIDDLNDEQKRCFLYSALHPAGTEISTDYLVKCWAAERRLGNIDETRTFRTACDEGYAMLRHLTNVSLLHTVEGLKHVKVNCIVQKVARYISLEDVDRQFLIGDTFQSIEDLQQVKRIFVIDTGLVVLPNIMPQCNLLLSLLLHKNSNLERIPLQFFNNMPELLVLNLYKTGIDSFPPSLECLPALRALFLNGCTRLTRLPLQTAPFPFLEVLDMRGCKVIFIPSFIGALVYLRCLRLSYYKPGTVNGFDSSEAKKNGEVILNLSKLEELVIDVREIDGCDSYGQWCIEATHVIQQVALLKNLTSLKICFPRLEDLRDLMQSRPELQDREPLSSFGSFVGCPVTHLQIPQGFDGSIKRYLRYCYDGSDYGSTSRFWEMDALELIGPNNITYLSDFVEALGLNGVLYCSVESCRNMVTIINGNTARGTGILPSLEHLHLKDLINLTSIFEGPLPSGSVSELRTIVVNHCISLSEIFFNGEIQQLSNLRKLIIHSCYLLKDELIVGGGSMQNLELLELRDLPNLKTISTSESLAWPKLRELRIYNCPGLYILPFNKTNAENLKLIEGEQAWWNDLAESNNEFKDHFGKVGDLRWSG